jgi:hypothetical protein
MGLITPHGLTNYLCDHNFDLREGWGVRQSFATPTRFELPKHVVSLKKLLTRQLKDMLTGMRHASISNMLRQLTKPTVLLVPDSLIIWREVLDPAHLHVEPLTAPILDNP